MKHAYRTAGDQPRMTKETLAKVARAPKMTFARNAIQRGSRPPINRMPTR
jgi:CTP:molybdopterin cytidylyltransferase MocA